ncbi:MAG: hypothetical protein ABR601_09590 [Parasphingopyxis sp.]
MTHSLPPHARPDPRSREVRSRRISRIPAFVPVPVRARRDGWTPLRQAGFLGALAETRCVKQAAAKVGMSRESAYRLRGRRGAASFAAVWDFILGPSGVRRPPRKVTLNPPFRRIGDSSLRPVMRAGRHVATIRTAEDSAILATLSRLDRAVARAEAEREKSKGHANEKTRWV